jgi:D-serine deaminase-like pyridoxal phosphate-dependent protein
MYTRLAGWFHLITALADYAEEAAYALAMLEQRAASPLRIVLELGSGPWERVVFSCRRPLSSRA